ncbi:MAG: outer membrane protein assembly factor BamA [Bacteroidetes bacterium]|nr:MAG: outer membrane protein assembly factor BamA [Bacteroidota bacterium]
MRLKTIIIFFIHQLWVAAAFAQDSTTTPSIGYIDYGFPRTYEVAGIMITGTTFYDKNVLQVLSGLSIGQKIRIPGEDIGKAINTLWKQKLFEDVKIKVVGIIDDKITLEIALKEKPRLSTINIKGLRKGKASTLRDELTIKSGQIITENLINTTRNEIKKFYTEKGFLDAKATFEVIPDDVKKNTSKLRITIKRGAKIKINNINIIGNNALTDKKVRRALKKTKEKRRLLAKSRYIEAEYEEDKQKIIEKYLALGYRDIEIVKDSVYRNDDKTLNIDITLNEGSKYYFRDIKFLGNTKYSTARLNEILKIQRGDVYNQSLLDSRLNMSQTELDISTLYMDDGYLFFRIEPVEVLVENDSIDLEIRILEGPQARINKVTVSGNTKTSDHVILRELRTKPGQLFSRSDITRSLRELASVGYFNPEALNVNPVPHPESGTVDIEYTVEERPNDQIELSAGWGANSIVGTLGLTLNNFSTRKMFDKSAWTPVPSGDGQRLSLRAQTNGTFFQSYSASLTEPWLGGKKPNALTVSVFHSVQSNGYRKGEALRSALFTTGLSIGLAKRLRWPDDYFVVQHSANLQRYNNVYNAFGQSNIPSIPQGVSNSLSYRLIVSRNSTDQPIYPRKGSNISLSIQATPPYSMFNGKDYSTISESERYNWLEFHKWKFDATFFTPIVGKLVIMSRANFGFIGTYNSKVGMTPFERFWVGGAGLTGFNLDGRELIALRGYQDNSLTPYNTQVVQVQPGVYIENPRREGGTIYNRYTFEVRYPISLNPQATVFPLIFAEGGGAWLKFRDFNPFQVYRSVGAGVRIFLPMFGMIGLDYGYGFDVPKYTTDGQVNRGNFHFLIGQQF